MVILPLSFRSYSFRSYAFEGVPDGYSTGGCVCMRVCASSLRSSEPTRRFSLMTPEEHPRRHHLADGPLLSLYTPSPSLDSFGETSVIMCCSARHASLSAPSVLPEDRIGYNIRHIRPCCDHINVVLIFDQTCVVLKLGWTSTTGLPDLWSSSPVAGSLADATANPMASAHHVALLREV